MAQYFVGVDGGATRCRARLRDSGGRELGMRLGPAANIYVDFAAGIQVVRELVRELITAAHLDEVERTRFALGLGLAGLSSPEDAERVVAALPGWSRVAAANDAVTACIGANGAADGGLIIAGT